MERKREADADTIKKLYQEGTKQLEEAEIPEAALDAWYLLEHLTGITRARYFLEDGMEVAEAKAEEYRRLIQKRCQHIPLQHLTGVQEFMGLEFQVNDQVLIPRQDTELLVEEALQVIKPGMRILDLCTGSGCILISILSYMNERQIKLSGVGADISEGALRVARSNAKKLHAEASFCQSDLFKKIEGKFDLIVSNPPYIRTAVIDQLQAEVKHHDPFLALDGKEDGLFFYRRITGESGQYLVPGGFLMVEIGYDQGEEVKEMFERDGYRDVQVKKDLSGLDRVVLGVYDK